MLLEENSKFLQPAFGQSDSPNFSILQSLVDTEMNSPFACDFGNDNNGLHFLDGTSEQDVSLTDLLDEVFHSHDDCSFEESTDVKNSVDRTEIYLPGQTWMLQNKPPLPTHPNYPSGACSDTNTERAQVFSSV